MKKTLLGLLALMIVGGLVSLAQADTSENITVRVTITSALDITVMSGTLVDFGEMIPGAVAVVFSTSTVIKNSGSGVNQTYKICADSPSGWTAGGTAAHNTYVLKAAFHGSAPANDAAFDTNDNILLEDADKTASVTVLTIGGTYTGASVAYNEERSIWYSFQPPSISSETGQQDITVTITAAIP